MTQVQELVDKIEAAHETVLAGVRSTLLGAKAAGEYILQLEQATGQNTAAVFKVIGQSVKVKPGTLYRYRRICVGWDQIEAQCDFLVDLTVSGADEIIRAGKPKPATQPKSQTDNAPPTGEQTMAEEVADAVAHDSMQVGNTTENRLPGDLQPKSTAKAKPTVGIVDPLFTLEGCIADVTKLADADLPGDTAKIANKVAELEAALVRLKARIAPAPTAVDVSHDRCRNDHLVAV